MCAIILVLATLISGCGSDKSNDEEQRKAAEEAKRAAAAAEAARQDALAYKIESVPSVEPDIVDEQIEYINQLEEDGIELLLPIAIKVPDADVKNSLITVILGKDYKIVPTDKWISRSGRDSLTLHHDSGIAVKFTNCSTGSNFKYEDVQSQLDSFYKSFTNASDASYRNILIGTQLSGREVGFSIEHNGRRMKLILGAMYKARNILIYTINYYVDDTESIKSEQIQTLLGTLKCGAQEVVIK